MWHKIQDNPPYLLKTIRANGIEVKVTNYVSIWYLNFSYDSFATCLQDSNCDMQVSSSDLIEKGVELLVNPTELNSINVTKCGSTLEVSMTKWFEYPVKLKLQLSEGTKEMFYQEFTQMLIRNVDTCNREEPTNLLKNVKDESANKKNRLSLTQIGCMNDCVQGNGVRTHMLNALYGGTSNMFARAIKQEIYKEHQLAESDPLASSSNNTVQNLEPEASNSETANDFDLSKARDKLGRSQNRELTRKKTGRVSFRSRSRRRSVTDSDDSQDAPTTSQAAHHLCRQFAWKNDFPQNRTVRQFNENFSGILQKCNFSSNTTELEFFEHFLDEPTVQYMVYCTNMNYKFTILKSPPSKHSRLTLWKELKVPEMYLFIAVTMLMTRNKHLTIEEHWSTDALLTSQIFSKIMTRNRYTMILSMISFSEPGSCNIQDPRLHPVRYLIDSARKKFKETFVPYSDLCVENSKVPFKGRLVDTETRFAIELFALCDVKTNYIVDFVFHSRTANEVIDAELGIGGSVVITLTKDYFGTHRKLYTGEKCTSPNLFKILLDNGIYACGAVTPNKVGMPRFNDSEKGKVHAKYAEGVLAIKWSEKKNGHLLSTWHDLSMRPSQKAAKKAGPNVPGCYIDYKRKMTPADNSDLMMSSLQCIWNSVTWHKKLAMRIFDMQLLNAFYTYKSVSKQNSQFAKFQLAVIRQLILKHRGNILQEVPKSVLQSNALAQNPARSTSEHMPKCTPGKKYMRCKVCAYRKQRKDTRYFCSVCQVYLCVVPCFQLYHQKK